MADLVAGSTLGSYEILKLLGRGGMGEVYLAEDLRLNRRVALKVLPSELSRDSTRLQRFKREAKSAAALNHPNICTIYEIGQENDTAFIAMEYIEGRSLAHQLGAEPLGIKTVLEIASQIADALEEARKRNIVHRDIKPANIMISAKNRVKVLDFGLAKFMESPTTNSDIETASHLTETGVVMGTIAYMSPEQALGTKVDHRSDLFSFGVVLYQMLSGRLPFSGISSTAVVDAILHDDPPALSRYNDHVPDGLLRIVNKMLRKDPEQRYQIAHDVGTDLREIPVDSKATTASNRVSVIKPSAVFAVLASIIAVVVAYFYFTSGEQQPFYSSIQKTSVVALPCKVYGPSESAYLTDAIPSTLSTLLGQVEGLETKLPPTSVEMEKIGGNLEKIADLYQVNRIISSSVSTQGKDFIMNIQLVEPKTKRAVWSRQYKGSAQNYNDLAEKAANEIREVIMPRAPALTQAFNRSSEAELAYRQGLHYSYLYNHKHELPYFDKSLSAFEKALQLDPQLADAAAEIAMLHLFKIESGAATGETWALLKQWALRALEINPKCGKAYTALGAHLTNSPSPEYAKGLELGIKAALYGPADPMNHLTLGFAISNGGLRSPTFVAFEYAHRLDPLYAFAPGSMLEGHFMLGNYAEASKWLAKTVEIEETPYASFYRGMIQAETNRLEEAKDGLQVIQRLFTEKKVPKMLELYLRHAVAWQQDDIERAEKVYAEILADPANFTTFMSAPEFTAPMLCRKGQVDMAVRVIARAHKLGYVPPYEWMMVHPALEPLRKDPRFASLLRPSRTVFDRTVEILEEAKARGELPGYMEKPLSDALTRLK